MTISELPEPIILSFKQPNPSPAEWSAATTAAGLSTYKTVNKSADGLQYTVQPLTLEYLLAELNSQSTTTAPPSVQELEQKYLQLPVEELLVRYEEAVTEFFALFYAVGKKARGNFVAAKILEGIKEKYWGLPSPKTNPPSTVSSKPSFNGRQLTINLDELD